MYPEFNAFLSNFAVNKNVQTESGPDIASVKK